MLQSDVLRVLTEACSSLEEGLEEASEHREYMQEDPDVFDDCSVVNYPIVLLDCYWHEAVEYEHRCLDFYLLVLEVNWLRQQVGSKEVPISNRTGGYLPKFVRQEF